MVKKVKKYEVGYSITFCERVQTLSEGARKKANQEATKWKANPTSPAYLYERIDGAVDERLHGLKLTEDHTAIVLRSPRQDAYLLLWIDVHEEALAWARKHQYQVNPSTGALQRLGVDPESEQRAGDDVKVGGIFDAYSGRQLERLGVPRQLMFRVRHATSLDAFEQLSLLLPSDAYEALRSLLAEQDYNDVLETVTGSSIPADRDVDVDDILTALGTDTSRQQFKIVETEGELSRVFSGDIQNWRVFLHRSQRRLATRSASGPVRVLGGAGTGKTVVAMHRAVHLVNKVFTDTEERVLFTTFTVNLAADIQANLETLCDTKTLKRIEVVSLDRWVVDFLKKHGFDKQIMYFARREKNKLYDLWNRVVDEFIQEASTAGDFSPQFLRAEWEQVIQAQGIRDVRGYLIANRAGRGRALRRKERKAIWPVFQAYRMRMSDEGWCEREDALYEARVLLDEEGITLPYCSVIVDEAQDMSNEAFKLVRAIVPRDSQVEERANDIFVVGDGHQRIYNHKVVLGRCGINIRGRAHRLKINYRTIEEIREFAIKVLEGIDIDDLDGEQDTQRGYISLMNGARPTVRAHRTFGDELDTIQAYLDQHMSPEAKESICLVARTKKQLKSYEEALIKRNIPVYRIPANRAEDLSAPGVRLATMHRVKGLEFDRVIMAGLDKSMMPLKGLLETVEDRESFEIQERALFYVACSRAKTDVLVTSSTTMSSFIDNNE